MGSSYAKYLEDVNAKMQTLHSSNEPARNPSSSQASVLVTKELSAMPPTSKFDALYDRLTSEMSSLSFYEPFFLSGSVYLPSVFNDRKNFLNNLRLNTAFEMFTYSHGNYLGSFTWLWKIPSPSERDAMNSVEAHAVCTRGIPIFHTRAMRAHWIQQYENLTGINKMLLRHMYRTLTSDASAPLSFEEAQADARLERLISMFDLDAVMEIRDELSSPKSKFDVFWDYCGRFIEGTLVPHDRRHSDVGYLPVAISMRDLVQQVTALCPAGTPIPSEQWVR